MQTGNLSCLSFFLILSTKKTNKKKVYKDLKYHKARTNITEENCENNNHLFKILIIPKTKIHYLQLIDVVSHSEINRDFPGCVLLYHSNQINYMVLYNLWEL